MKRKWKVSEDETSNMKKSDWERSDTEVVI